MSFSRRSVSAGLVAIAFSSIVGFPRLAVADEVPASVAALLPAGATRDHGDWAVMETEFGKTFGGGLHAATFPGQSPSCAFGYTPSIDIQIKGDTAFENPPMLDMAIEIHEQDIARALEGMARFVSKFPDATPDSESIGELRHEQRANGHLMYVEYQENCKSHPHGAKTSVRAYARRGATQLEFSLVLALDSAAATAMANEILASFAKLDIAALTD